MLLSLLHSPVSKASIIKTLDKDVLIGSKCSPQKTQDANPCIDVSMCKCQLICGSCKENGFIRKCSKRVLRVPPEQKFEKIRLVCSNDRCGKIFEADDESCEFMTGHSKENQETSRGVCKHCHNIVNRPHTQHLQVTYFHPSECDMFRSNCPNCKLKDVRIKSHFQVCPLKPKPCILHKMGCQGITNSMFGLCSLEKGHRELAQSILKHINGIIQSYEDYMSNENEHYKSQNEEIMTLNSEITELRNLIQMDRIIDNVPRNGVLIWKIDDAYTFLDQNLPQFSPPVYTDNHGYKLCLKVYPKGNGIGEGTHLSLYFVIMKGCYDDLLPWPFKKLVEVTVYNRNVRGLSKHETYKTGKNLATMGKPETEFNAAIGNPKFIKLEDLRTNGFIIEDGLFFQLCVNKDKSYL